MATEEAEPGGRSWGEQLRPTSVRVGIAAFVFALITGMLAAWGTANLGISGLAFLLVGVVAGAYLWHKPLATEVIGSGLYISAILLALIPIGIYVPNVMTAGEADTAREAGMVIGSVFGLFIWGFVFLVIGIVVAAFGYFFKKRAAKKRDAAA